MSLNPTVVVITQTMRIAACISYIDSISRESTITVFTGDAGAFTGVVLSDLTSIRSTRSPNHLIPDAAQLRRVGRRRLLEWMRSGSKIGRFSEKAATRIVRILWRRDKAAGQGYQSVAPHPVNTYLVGELESLHRKNALMAIVVFDVFDLPTVLAFAERTGVAVMVR